MRPTVLGARLVLTLAMSLALTLPLSPAAAPTPPVLHTQPTQPAPRLLQPPPLAQLLQQAGATPADMAPDPEQWARSSSSPRQFPLYRAVMSQPLQAPYRVGMLTHQIRQVADSAHELVGMAGVLAGLRLFRPAEQSLQATATLLQARADPLAASLEWMAAASGQPQWQARLPATTALPDPLRFELAMVLATLGQSQLFLQRAFAALPPALTPTLLRRQALDGDFKPFEEPDYRRILSLVEREALLAGMLDLTAAVERLQAFVRSQPSLPALAWALDTPFGQIVLDTTGRNNQHRLQDPLLVLDVGGDDHYVFLPRSDTHRLSVLLDHGGNDRYTSTSPGADPSAASLGYGIVWDTLGDDNYEGTQQAQASALFGAALLVDGAGHNQYRANSHAQAHAIAGLAVLMGSPGDDRYTAQTHAQASAGAEGVALLIEPAGADQYTLDNTPLLRPSPQLPSHNTSMGQGAGRGIRANAVDGRSTTGGIGLLYDLGGDDRYTAQVFAQGVGYHEGLGMLVDDHGNDQFEAAWYAQGAAAHRGAGVLMKRGTGHDRYQASHSTAIGAAHDFSVGIFLDEGGNDQYSLGDLGLGAAHDNSTALFVDAAGDDRYAVQAVPCRAFGAARLSGWGDLRENLPNLGLFMDLGGADHYPSPCNLAKDNSAWSARRTWPQLHLRSEAGAGIDGEFPLPFPLGPLTH